MAIVGKVKILAPTIVRYTFRHQWGAHKFDNVQDISIDAGSGTVGRPDVINDLNSHVCGWWQDSLLGPYSSDCVFLGAHWIDLDSLTGATGDLGPAAGHPTHGGGFAPFAPPNVNSILHKRTTSGRGTRPGRTFFPNISESLTDDDGFLASGYVSSLNSLGEQFRSTIRSYNFPTDPGVHPAAWRVVHVHKPDKNDASTWTWSSSDVSGVTCDPRVGTQRRRLRG